MSSSSGSGRPRADPPMPGVPEPGSAPRRSGSATAIRSGLAGGLAAADHDGPLVEPADDLDLERRRVRGQGLEQLVAIGDRLAGHLDDEIALLDPGAIGIAAVLDATDQ